MDIRVLTHLVSRPTPKRVICRECRPRSDAAECGVIRRRRMWRDRSDGAEYGVIDQTPQYVASDKSEATFCGV